MPNYMHPKEITNGELMRELLDLKGDVGLIKGNLGETKGKLDTFIKQLEVQDNRTTNLDTRVRSVESRIYWASGAGSILGTIAGWFGSGHFKP